MPAPEAGSKDRGGAYALRQAVRALKDGYSLVMTADVPPGPARRAGIGIVMIARLSGRPIVPCAAATSRFRALNTWSRMTINLPGSKLAYVAGDPIWVPHDAGEAELEFARVQVERALNAATARAYEIVGADLKRVTPPNLGDPTSPPADPDFRLKVYRTGMSLLRPVAPLILKMRERSGKEDARRRGERLGQANVARPNGVLCWFHAASVGETNAVLPVIEALGAARPDLNFLLTTGTVTSAGLAERRLGPRAVHQYVPLDAPEYAARFLQHWQPDLAVFTESEIWPSLILETACAQHPDRARQRPAVAPQPPPLAAQQDDGRPIVRPLQHRAGAKRPPGARLRQARCPQCVVGRQSEDRRAAAARRSHRAGAAQGGARRPAGVRRRQHA